MPTSDVPDCKSYYKKLHEESGAVLSSSLSLEAGAVQAQSHDAVAHLESWLEVLPSGEIRAVVRGVLQEYQMGLLALAQGFYRHAFASLRYCLERTVAVIFLSAHELYLRLWLTGDYEVTWNALLDPDKGVFSPSFGRAFCPTLRDEMPHYAAMARRVYRECSEYVHGNPEADYRLPATISFSEELFRQWHARAATVRLILHFTLASRYLAAMTPDEVRHLEFPLQDELGHLPQVRAFLDRAPSQE
jgi:hypothetical protein